MTRAPFSSLRVRLTGLVLLAVLPALGFLLYYAAEQRRVTELEAHREASRIVGRASRDLDRCIDKIQALLAELARRPEVRGADPATGDALLADYLQKNPLLAHLAVVQLNGNIVSSAPPLSERVQVADETAFKRALETRDLAIGNYAVNRVSRKPSIHFAYPALDPEEQVSWVVCAAMPIEQIYSLIADTELPEGATIACADFDGAVIAHFPASPASASRQGKPMPPALLKAIHSFPSQDRAELPDEDGQERLYAFAPLFRIKRYLTVVAGLSKRVTFEPIDQVVVFSLAVLALVVLLALAVAWIGGDLLILRRIQALARTAERLHAGDLDARLPDPSGQGELDQLDRTFNDMAAALQRRQADAEQARTALQARHDFQKAVSALTVHFTHLRTDGIDAGIRHALRALGTLTGADRAAVIQIQSAGGLSDLSYEWCADDVEPRAGQPPRRLLDAVPTFAEKIRKLEAVVVPRVAGLPPEARVEQDALREAGIRSFLAVPMARRGTLTGYLAIEAIRQERPWSDEAVELLRIVGEIITGTLDRRRIEKALQESEERFRYLFERSIQGILVYQDGIIRYANPTLLRILGYGTTEELVGRPIWETLPAPEERPALQERAERVLRGETVPAHFGWQALRKDGSRIWVQSTANLVTWEKRPAVCAFLLDVTERVLAEQTLRKQQQEQQLIFDSVPAMIWYKDSHNRILRVNRAAAAARGVTPQDMEGRPTEEFYPDEAARYHDDDLEVIRTGQPKLGIIEHHPIATGEKVIVRTDRFPYRDERGAIIGTIAISVDITERVRAEEADRERTELLLRHQAALLRLAKADPADYDAILLQITEEASATLGVARAGVWRLAADASELVCEDLYRRPEGRHERGARLAARDCPRYLKALAEHRSLAVPDAPRDPNTNELTENYWKPLGITSTLDVAVTLGGRMVGVVCFEHVGSPRDWTAEEQNFAAAIADLASLALAASQRKRAELQLRDSEALYHSLVENLPQNIMRKDRRGRITFCNQRFCALAGKEARELIGKTDLDLYPPHLAEKYRRDDLQVMQTHKMLDTVEEHRRPGGETLYVRVVKSPLFDAAGSVIGVQIFFWDVSEQRRAEDALARERNLLYILMDHSPDTIFFKDRDLRFIRINRALALRFGLGNPDEAAGKTVFDFYAEEHARQANEDEVNIIRTGEPLIAKEEQQVWPNGNASWVSTTKIPFRDPEGTVLGIFGISRDITERKHVEDQLVRQAFYDTLTHLPNRALFIDRLGHALRRSRRSGQHCAVLFLDLDRFKNVNDSLGHLVGDQLLIALARRIETCLRPGDTVARLGGDEFTILLEEIKTDSDAIVVADRVAKALASPFVLDGHEVFTTASVGIAPSTPSNANPEDLLRDADTAMYRAKEEGRNRHAVFHPSMRARVVERLQIETDMRRGLERREFLIQYQPIVSLASRRLVGFESLVRWRHPQRGLLQPREFLPAAEENGLIVPIGHWVLRESCRQTREWQTRFPSTPPLIASVNLSVKQFAQSDLSHYLDEILRESGMSSDTLMLEITESALLENFSITSAALAQMKALRLQLNLDDFGTGYCSLRYLHRFPIRRLKIHPSFIGQLASEGEALDVVQSILTLARNLKMEVVAEGVETAEQVRRLHELHFDLAQGFYFSPPVDADAATALLAEGKEWR